MQKRVWGLLFHQFPEVGKLIKPDGHNEIYNITYALTIGHEYKTIIKIRCLLVTSRLTTVTAGVSLFSSQRTVSDTGSR